MKTGAAYMDEEKLARIGDQISEVLYDIDREELLRGHIDTLAPVAGEVESIAEHETDSVGEMSSDDLLDFIAENDLSCLEKINPPARADGEEEIEIRLRAGESLKSIKGVSDLTRLLGFELLISKDRLRCYATIDTMYYKSPPKAASILNTLEQAGITFGLETPEKITRRVLETVETGGGPFVVAIGKPPKKGRNAFVKYMFDFTSKRDNPRDEKENIDHRETGRHTQSVAAGEILAAVTPPGKGEPGMDIFGMDIPGQNGREAPVRAGKNVTMDTAGLKYYATAPGQVILTMDELSVIPVLNIDGDLDYSVGNIDFKGSVRIKGSVLDGFRINAGGDVTIDRNVEGAFIECGGDLTVRGGIVGRGVAQVDCSGSLKTGFIENASVSAEGNVIVSKGIVHSEVISNGNVIVTDRKGKIVGGRVISRNLVESNSIGSRMEVKTEICVGRDAGIQKILWGLAEKKDLLVKHLEKIKQLEEKTRQALNEGQNMPDKLKIAVRAALDKKRRILVAVGTIIREEKQYRIKMVKDIPGRIKVEGEIYPNTNVEIGFCKKKFDDPATHTLLVEDKINELVIQLDMI